MAIAFHHQRFQHQFTFSHQLIFQLIEMIERRAAVIQYPHREHGVECRQIRQLLDAERQQVGTLIAAQQFAHGFKLTQEQLHRIDTHGEVCAGADHAPQVIAAATADVENGAAGQRRNVRQHAIPFPIGMPFCIDIDAIQRERPFTPRHQGAQHFLDALELARRQGWLHLGAYAVQQIEAGGGQRRQMFDRVEPLFEFAVQRFALPGAELRRQGVQPMAEGLLAMC